MSCNFIAFFLLGFGVSTESYLKKYTLDTNTLFNPKLKDFREPDQRARNIYNGRQKWPNARIPYEFHRNLDSIDRVEIYKSFNNIHSKTCVRFVPKEASDEDWVSIERDDTLAEMGGLAELCKVGGRQFLKISWRSARLITHELMHTLCFNHEQGRLDRDKYLDTSACEIPKQVHQYETLDLFYDYVSAMHYPCDSCLKPKMEGVNGTCWNDQNGALSVLDAEKINKFYNCSRCYSYRFKPIGKINDSEMMHLFNASTNIDGTAIYICRAYHKGDILPGWTRMKPNSNCTINIEKEVVYAKRDFEVLTNPSGAPLRWAQFSGSFQDLEGFGAVPIGRTSMRIPLYIGRCQNKTNGKYLLITFKGIKNFRDEFKDNCKGSFKILKCSAD